MADRNENEKEESEKDLCDRVREKREAYPGEPKHIGDYRRRLMAGSHAAHHVPMPNPHEQTLQFAPRIKRYEPSQEEQNRSELLQKSAKKHYQIP